MQLVCGDWVSQDCPCGLPATYTIELNNGEPIAHFCKCSNAHVADLFDIRVHHGTLPCRACGEDEPDNYSLVYNDFVIGSVCDEHLAILVQDVSTSNYPIQSPLVQSLDSLDNLNVVSPDTEFHIQSGIFPLARTWEATSVTAALPPDPVRVSPWREDPDTARVLGFPTEEQARQVFGNRGGFLFFDDETQALRLTMGNECAMIPVVIPSKMPDGKVTYGSDLAESLLRDFFKNPHAGIAAVAYDAVMSSGGSLADFFELLTHTLRKDQ